MAELVFSLPDLGEGLEDAVVTQWLVAEGDDVELNQPIAEIETAKAVVEMPSPFAARVLRLHVEAGGTVRVGSALATFDVDASSEPSPEKTSSEQSVSQRAPASETSSPERATATPAVRRLAKDLGVDLASVAASGTDGRITREDVEATLGRDDVDVVPVSVTRKGIAENLTKVAAIPQVTTFRDVDCTALDAVRSALGVSPLPLLVRALADVCADHRMLNASWAADRILVHRRVNVGVATDTERGLVIPVLKDAASKGIAAIAEEIRRLAEGARSNSLQRDELAGATITVTNTGSYGSESGTPLLNPGHAVTIALGVIQPRPRAVDERVEVRPTCTLSLTFDHRVLDGATVGRAFGSLVGLLESAERLRALPA